ncbi:putative ribonucleoside diphosphate reductase small subunit [Diachasmimorpha longicaudata entomopoxvirus]|uniref:ribonucleoside-diphosphate reductase n=1 Tax=Diachasmimorpha longicaudata entomopoxvirus TaxID=109981 RepID=A0A7R5WCW6_9POXV|nr:putative ribonucleoside diphosphate reductase small subunit [Diachasmimorpha longicaudata entomopoxvirus]AKS26322.1 putative ribonucleoside diphosphate reductase small subunit [Diachasmimorpha longicaudata entomopoxvirus]
MSEFRPINETIQEDVVIMNFFKQQQQQFWTVEEIPYDENDQKEFKNLPKPEQEIIKTILLFFTKADKLVIDALDDFVQKVPYQSAQYYYKAQIYIEAIHDMTYKKSALMYSESFDEFRQNNEKFENLISDYRNNPNSSNSSDPIMRAALLKLKMFADFKNQDNTAYQLATLFLLEALAFNPFFVILSSYRKNNKGVKYLVEINDFILKDEHIHAVFGMTLYRDYLQKKLPVEEFMTLLDKVVETEIRVLDEIFPKDLVINGFTAEHLGNYVKFLANDICKFLGYDSYYKEKLDFPNKFQQVEFSSNTNQFERTAAYVVKSEFVPLDFVLSHFK